MRKNNNTFIQYLTLAVGAGILVMLVIIAMQNSNAGLKSGSEQLIAGSQDTTREEYVAAEEGSVNNAAIKTLMTVSDQINQAQSQEDIGLMLAQELGWVYEVKQYSPDVYYTNNQYPEFASGPNFYFYSKATQSPVDTFWQVSVDNIHISEYTDQVTKAEQALSRHGFYVDPDRLAESANAFEGYVKLYTDGNNIVLVSAKSEGYFGVNPDNKVEVMISYVATNDGMAKVEQDKHMAMMALKQVGFVGVSASVVVGDEIPVYTLDAAQDVYGNGNRYLAMTAWQPGEPWYVYYTLADNGEINILYADDDMTACANLERGNTSTSKLTQAEVDFLYQQFDCAQVNAYLN